MGDANLRSVTITAIPSVLEMLYLWLNNKTFETYYILCILSQLCVQLDKVKIYY